MKTMGILVRTPGDAGHLEYTELETAAPGPGELLVEHRAIGVNFIDTYFRAGLYPWPSATLVPGNEAAGVVLEAGRGVAGFAAGDRVAYTLPPGAYRQRRVVPADRMVRLPDVISFEVAASVMLKGLTAQFLVNACHAVKPGDTVLVHAAAGGVGLLLGQWLRLLGARAIGTAGSAEKAALARENGYAHVIDYRTEDFAARVKDITGGALCDVVYDSVGKDTYRGSLKCLRRRGLFVAFGQSSGVIGDFKVSDLQQGGSLYATRPTLYDYIANREDLERNTADLFARLASGQIRAHVGRTLPLREAAEAHRALEGRRTMGATVLLP